jgi:hypothetical protein
VRARCEQLSIGCTNRVFMKCLNASEGYTSSVFMECRSALEAVSYFSSLLIVPFAYLQSNIVFCIFCRVT